MTHVDLVVVGGGITGLAAAWEAQQRGASVVLLEANSRVGGKLRTSSVGGVPVDESADAFLARRPEAVELCAEVGLTSELVAPATSRAYVWADGQLRPLPAAQLLGVPTDLDAVAATGILSEDGLARAAEDLRRSDDRPDGDEPVGALIRRRLGDEVLDRLVAPLVGGIWAGDCDRLSLETATPALAEARRSGPCLIEAAGAVRAAATDEATSDPGQGAATPRPVFLAPRGGMGRLVDALVSGLGSVIRTLQTVDEIERLGGSATGRWRVPSADLTADSVVLATPAWATRELLVPHSLPAVAMLGGIDHAAVALVTLAVPRDGIDHPLDGSGFLVPPSAGHTVTACSWASSKWAQLSGDGSTAILRASVGRDGQFAHLTLDNETVVGTVVDDLRKLMGLRADPVEARVNRWLRSFPQPRPGHLDRVAALEADLARDTPGLTAAGAWARGVGIPACIQSGRRAATVVLQ